MKNIIFILFTFFCLFGSGYAVEDIEETSFLDLVYDFISNLKYFFGGIDGSIIVENIMDLNDSNLVVDNISLENSSIINLTDDVNITLDLNDTEKNLSINDSLDSDLKIIELNETINSTNLNDSNLVVDNISLENSSIINLTDDVNISLELNDTKINLTINDSLDSDLKIIKLNETINSTNLNDSNLIVKNISLDNITVINDTNIIINSSENLSNLNYTTELQNNTNITIIDLNLNLNLTNELNDSEEFYWKRNILNLYPGSLKNIIIKIKVNKTLKNITDELEKIKLEKPKKGLKSFMFSISSLNIFKDDSEIKLENLKNKIKNKTNNKYAEVQIENISLLKNINFNNLVLEDNISLGVEELNRTEFIQSFAIDPSNLNFTSAVVTLVAKGNKLFKCKDWNFTIQSCYGDWILFKDNLVPGKEYNFTLTPDDPGFGEEINVTAASHLDSNKTFISDIFEVVQNLDGIWSEFIYSGEYIRASFEENMTNGNVINLFVRNVLGLNSFIEVYEKNGSVILGTTEIIDETMQYDIELSNMEGFNDVFDIKIVNVEDNLTAYLEFDYVHDAASLDTFSGNFFEGFESGSLSTNNWTTGGAGVAWAVGNGGEAVARTGTFNIRVENTVGESTIETGLDTIGYQNINFSFWATTESLDAGEYLAADWWNGTLWNNLMTVEDIVTYTEYSFNLTNDADNNPNFKIRFRCSSDKNNEDCEVDDITVTGTKLISMVLIDAYGVDGSGDSITVFNNTAVENIDTMRLNFSITSGETIDSWYLNFTASGKNGCSLGNKQSSVCYFYPNWIQFINGSETATFDGVSTGQIGDFITVERSDFGDVSNFSFLIDEHYNPNVFKRYDANFNFSDVKWQNESSYRITGDNQIKVEINETLVPTDIDLMKLDLNVDYVGFPDELEVYACNSSYSNQDIHTYSGCSLVVVKSYNDFEEGGTKVKGIYTRGLLDTIGNLRYFILHTEEINLSEYYYIKTYKAKASNYTTHWEYSNDLGLNWNNSNDGYETELNINWFYGGDNKTAFNYLFWANTTSGNSDYFEGNITWDIDAASNYPPLVTMLQDLDEFGVRLPLNKTFITSDTNNDNLNVSLYLYKSGVLNYTIVTGLNENDTYYIINNSILDDLYVLVLEACEIGTTELYCTNDTVNFLIDSIPPEINFVSPTMDSGSYVQNYIVANLTSSDVNIENLYLRLYNSTGLVHFEVSTTLPLFYNFTNLTDGIYYLNGTSNDFAGNTNITETRTIILDNNNPNVTIITPLNITYNTTVNIPLNYSLIEAFPDTCFYSLNGGANITITGCLNTTINTSAGSNTLILYVNDTIGNLDSDSVIFTTFVNTSLDVFDSKDPVEVLEEFRMYANYTYAHNGTSILGVSCNIDGDFGIFEDGRMISFEESSGTEPIDTEAIYGNNTRRYDFNNLLVGGVKYHPLIKYHKKGNPADDLKVYVNCDGNNIINDTYLIGNESAADSPLEPNWTFSIIDFPSISSENCSVFVTSPNSVDYNNSYHILKSNITGNGTFYSEDLGDSWNSSNTLDVVEFGHIWPNTTTTYNVTSGLYESNYLMHVDSIGNHNYNFSCSKTNYISQNLTEIITAQDNAVPFVQITRIDPNPAEFGVDNVTIEWLASDFTLDTKKINITYPNGTLLFESIISPVNLNISQLSILGNYTIYAWANDSAGLEGSSIFNLTVQDTIFPTIDFVSPTTESGNYSQNFIVSNVSATNGGGVDTITINLYNLTGLFLSNSSFVSPFFWNITDLTDGTYFLNASANDTSGNENITETRTIILDTTAPIIDFVSPTTESGNYSQDYIFGNVTASDASLDSIVIYLYNLSGLVNSSTSSSNFSINFSSLVDGTYFLNASVNDTFGNNNITETRTIVLDNVAPTINIISPLNQNYINATILVNISSDGDNIWYNWNGSNVSYSTALNIVFDEGFNTLFAYANDSSGNLNSSSVNFTIDTLVPTITFVSPTTEFGNYSQDYIFGNVTASDASLDSIVIYLYNSSGLVNSSSNSSNFSINFSNLIDGTYFLNASVNDTFGNNNITETRTIVLDNVAPIFINLVNQTIFSGNVLSYDIDASDSVGVDCFSVNDSVNFNINCSGYLTNSTSLNLGIYWLNISVNDSVGNVKFDIISVSVQPQVLWSNITESPEDLSYYFPPQEFNFSVIWTSDYIDSVWIEWDGVNYTNEVTNISNVYSFNRSNLKNGIYNYTWYANTSFGNLNSTFQNYTLLALQDYRLNGTIIDWNGSFLNATFKIFNSTEDLVYQNNGSFDYLFSGVQKYDFEVTALYDEFVNRFWLLGLFNNTNKTSVITSARQGQEHEVVLDPTTIYYDTLIIEQKPQYPTTTFFEKCIGYYNVTDFVCTGIWEPWYNVKSLGFANYSFIWGDPALREGSGTFFEDFENNSLLLNNWTLTGGILSNWTIKTDNPYAGIYYIEAEATGSETRITTNISTLSYENIFLSFYYDVTTLNDTEYLKVEWYNGTDWNNVLNLTNLTTDGYTIDSNFLGDDADNNPDFGLRFICSVDTINRFCRIDNIVVNGDKIPPFINFENPSTETGNYSQNFILSNVSVITGLGVDNITINLYNSSGLVLSNSSPDSPFFWNITNLADGIYYLNATVNDSFSAENYTETRTILLDTTPPSFTNLVNQIITTSEILNYDIDASDFVGVDCFSVNDTANFNINCSGYLTNLTNLSIGIYWLNISVNDTLGNEEYDSISINVTDALSDTCTYSGSGNWVVACSDNCSISSNVNLFGNNISITGVGTFSTTANITNFVDIFIAGTSFVNRCDVFCSDGGCFK